ITGGVGTSAGSLAMDRSTYGSTSAVQLKVVDTNASGPLHVTLTSESELAGEDVTLTGSNGVFTGSLTLQPYLSAHGDNRLQVSNGDVLTATYQDASPAATIVAHASVAIGTPVISGVGSTNLGGRSEAVTWQTDRNATSRVYYG